MKTVLGSLRVIEHSAFVAAPLAGMSLAQMGAEVIRIDRPGQRDNQTRLDVLNRSRRSLAVDLKKPGGKETVLRLVGQADALVEGFRPGVMERLGLGYEVLRHLRQGLVMVSVSASGQTGPERSYAGYAPLQAAFAAAAAASTPTARSRWAWPGRW